MVVLVRGICALFVVGCLAADPPGRAPFDDTIMMQPVKGAPRATNPDGWRSGRLCDVSKTPYDAQNGTNATAALQTAIDDCGDLPGGGTVLVPSGLVLKTASLWLRSNLTLRVEAGSTLLGTATGLGDTAESIDDAPVVYTRRDSVMVPAHAGLLNAGRCLKFKDPVVGWDDCAEWSKLHNVAIEGGGTLDANSQGWFEVYAKKDPTLSNWRPMMLDLLWVDGLTIKDMQIRRPGYWTVHPTFCNNVVVVNNSIVTTGMNTDGCDPDSAWNVYIAGNTFSTGDDCIAIKAGRDWSGRMVNISTTNVLAEHNTFYQGHGVSIGSETSGWVRNITIRDSYLNGTNLAVRIKSMRGRGGGVEDVVYNGLRGSVQNGVQLTLNYHPAEPTNWSATPEIRRITVRDLEVHSGGLAVQCDGLDDSVISEVSFESVQISGSTRQACDKCEIQVKAPVAPMPKCSKVLKGAEDA